MLDELYWSQLLIIGVYPTWLQRFLSFSVFMFPSFAGFLIVFKIRKLKNTVHASVLLLLILYIV